MRAPRRVSVVVCVLNAERWLGEQLEALAAQTYDGDWELLLVDNGCTDRSMEIAAGWRQRLPRLRVVDARERRSLNHARNAGAAAAAGDFLAYCDADDVVAPTWLAALVAAAPRADIVGGTFDLEALNPPLAQAWRPDEPPVRLPDDQGFLPYANGGNCGIWTEVARSVRWDDDFEFGHSETEFCWRAQLAGHTLAFAPDAVVRLRYRRELRDLVRQYFGYGRATPLLYSRFRELGMARDNDEALWWWRWLARRWRHLLDPEARGRWLKMAALRCGRLRGSLAARVLYL
jgi:glycosyltransferase involved in cell wall biosynthesis